MLTVAVLAVAAAVVVAAFLLPLALFVVTVTVTVAMVPVAAADETRRHVIIAVRHDEDVVRHVPAFDVAPRSTVIARDEPVAVVVRVIAAAVREEVHRRVR